MSSIKNRLCCRANAMTASRSKGLPSVCASMMPRVRGESASSSQRVSMLYVPRSSGSTSRKTGTRPFCRIGLMVVGKLVAVVIISSPGCSCLSPRLGEVRAASASRFADEPELTSMACRTPTVRAREASNSNAKRPLVSQKSNAASTRYARSSSSKTRPATCTGVSPGTKDRGLRLGGIKLPNLLEDRSPQRVLSVTHDRSIRRR